MLAPPPPPLAPPVEPPVAPPVEPPVAPPVAPPPFIALSPSAELDWIAEFNASAAAPCACVFAVCNAVLFGLAASAAAAAFAAACLTTAFDMAAITATVFGGKTMFFAAFSD